MDESLTTKAEFVEAVQRLAAAWVVWLRERGVEGEQMADADCWCWTQAGARQHQEPGLALTVRSQRLGVTGMWACGGAVHFRQHRRVVVHTVLPGRDVEVRVQYGQCAACRRGWPPRLPTGC